MTNAKPVETDMEVRRERGMSVVVIGWLLWGFALLFLFFLPAELKMGRWAVSTQAEPSRIFYVVVALGAVGLVLNIIGWRMRNRALK